MTNGTTEETALSRRDRAVLERLARWVVSKDGDDVMAYLAAMNDDRFVREAVLLIATGLYDGFYDVDKKFARLLDRATSCRTTSRKKRCADRINVLCKALDIAIDAHRQTSDDAGHGVVIETPVKDGELVSV